MHASHRIPPQNVAPVHLIKREKLLMDSSVPQPLVPLHIHGGPNDGVVHHRCWNRFGVGIIVPTVFDMADYGEVVEGAYVGEGRCEAYEG